MKDNFGNFLQTSQYWINKMFVLTEKILQLRDWILQFQNRCNKLVIELRVVQFKCQMRLVISNQTRAVRLFIKITGPSGVQFGL